ncbi:hypothetical protein Pcinc_003530 [Petrolisthes cinctipes]|uniref:Iron-binding zinc finger CDGSH type domain-containing protein n=1 Tax=Petrolisthes cinctipes TaxID=88211 RepID=A0AAE1L134_PETCI|nr:hypothetical protein Pcinc_003530 [Petrolisthes cinctipes]
MAAVCVRKSSLLLYNLPVLRHSRTLSSGCVLLGKVVRDPGVSLLEKQWQREFYQKEKGKIYDKKPFRLTLQPGKQYLWCACGHSKTQPFCDGTHLMPQLRIRVKPILFRVCQETDVWMLRWNSFSISSNTTGLHLNTNYLFHHSSYHHRQYNNLGRTPKSVPTTNGLDPRLGIAAHHVVAVPLQAQPLTDRTSVC